MSATKLTRIAIFNVHGLKAAEKKIDLTRDIIKYRVDICCLQETKVRDESDETIIDIRVILIPGKCRHYGLGFAMNKRSSQGLIKFNVINDRIAVATFRLSGRKELKIVNVYGPTLERSTKSPEERESFYEQLESEVRKIGDGTSYYISADFNSKLGLSSTDSTCVGTYWRGIRNENGEHLLDFCETYTLRATNTLPSSGISSHDMAGAKKRHEYRRDCPYP